MSPLLNLYRTQFRILREWRGGTWALVRRIIIVTLVAAVSFLLASWIMPGITPASLIVLIQVIVVMALINTLIRPVALAFVAPRSLVLTGVAELGRQPAAGGHSTAGEPG